jgi:hypothetical protein
MFELGAKKHLIHGIRDMTDCQKTSHAIIHLRKESTKPFTYN